MARQYRTSLVISGDASGGIRAVRATESELRKLDAANNRTARATEQSTRQITTSYNNVARTVSRTSAAIAALGAGAVATSTIRSYAEFDRGLIGVSKTTNIVGDELDALGSDIQSLAQDVPVATRELLEIAQSAGQLGVNGRDNILRFTKTVAQLGTATDLAGEEAATTFARLLTVTGEPIKNVDRLGASVVQLGNNFAATESEIAKSSQRVAQATSQYDAGAANVVGIGTALAATGVQAEEGGTQIGLAFQSINNALRNGGEQMQLLERITGQTGDALREQFFNGESAQVFQSFVDGLGRIQQQGGDVSAALSQMDLSGTGAVRVLGTLATRSDVLSNALQQANQGFEQNIALNQEAARASESFSAQMQFVQNAADQAAAELGKVIAPGLISGMGTARDLAIGLADNMDTVVTVSTLAAAALGGRLAGSLATATAAKINNTRATIAQLAAERDAAQQTLRYAAAEDSAAASALNMARAEYQAARGTNAEATALANLRARQVAAIETRGAYNASLAASTAATRAYTSATNVAAVAARGLRTAMGFLGGPAGVAILAATAIYEFRDELGLTSNPAKDLKKQVDQLTASLDKNSQASINNNLEKYRQQLVEAKKAAAEAQAQLDESNSPAAARVRNPYAFQMSMGRTVQGDQAQQELSKQKQSIKAITTAIGEAEKAKVSLDKRLRGESTATSPGQSGGAGNATGDSGIAKLLNEYDTATVKLNELRAARQRLTQAMQTAGPDTIGRYRAALENIDAQIKQVTDGTEKAGRVSRKSLSDAERAAKQLDEAYQQSASTLEQQIALYGQTSRAAQTAYEIEHGNLQGINAQRQESLIQMARQLDMLDRQREAVRNLLPEFEQLDQARQLRQSVADLPPGMQAFGQRRADQLAAESATQGLPGMQGLDPQFNGPFGEAGRLENERAQYEQQYQTRLEAFRQYAQQHQDEKATADAAIEALERDHQNRMQQYDDQTAKARREGYEQLYGSLADTIGAFAGTQSGIFRGMFAAQKAFHLANTIMASTDAIAKAWASAPFPANLPAVATTAAQTGVLQAAVSSVSLQGQAHDGIDNVPNSGTWNLEKGERVVDARMNKDLSRYLNNQTTNNRQGDRINNVTVAVTVQGQRGQSDAESQRQGQQIGRGIQDTIRAVIVDEKRPGGSLQNVS